MCGRDLSIRPRLGLGQAWDGRHRGLAAHGDDHGLARLVGLIIHAHASLTVEPTVATYQRDLLVFEPGKLLRVIQIMDHLVAAPQNSIHVKRARDSLCGARNPARLSQRLGRAQQCLGGHAGIEGAFASNQLRLDQGDLVAASSETSCHHLARGTGADHDHVEHPHCRRRHPRGHYP